MSGTGIIVLAHGSRGEKGKGEVESALASTAAGLRARLAPGVMVTGAALQFNRPNLEEATAALAAEGVSRIIVAPYFLFRGRHITEDLPELVHNLRASYPAIGFLIADNPELNGTMAGLMAAKICQAAPDLAPAISRATSSIEQESMRIIEGLLPPLPGVSPDEVMVLKRIVHASGDSGIVPLVKFSPSAIDSGVSAIASGKPIFTDVRMLLAGIDGRLAGAFGCKVACALDELAHGGGEVKPTRTAVAVSRLGDRLNGAIIAIGNAPTALFALLRLVDEGITPALVVGMPVGFVQAGESKQKLTGAKVPYITVVGTRGGSPLAAATVNALLRIAAGRREGAVKEDERC